MTQKKILIAIDGSEHSYYAARKIRDLFQEWQPEIALVFVLDPLQTIGNPEAGLMPHEAAIVLKKAAEIAFEECEKLWPEKKISRFITEGKPPEKIIETAVAWQADMITLGTHGRTGLLHLLVGSVAESVLRKSPIPVMVVPMR